MVRQTERSASLSGFSAIELAIVMAIMAALVGLSAGQILPAMRRASVNEAIALIEEANQRARIMSIRGSSEVFGVRLIDDGTGDARVQILERSVDSNSSGSLATHDVSGLAIFDQDIDDAAIIWLGDVDMRSDASPQIEWYFDSSGRLVHTDGSVSNVGFIGGEFSSATVPWVGGAIGDALKPIAPESASGAPGLSIRTADDSYRLAVAIGSLGNFFDKEF